MGVKHGTVHLGVLETLNLMSNYLNETPAPAKIWKILRNMCSVGFLLSHFGRIRCNNMVCTSP